MADFDKAIPTVLMHEGLLSDDPDDTGGTTKFGISLQFLRQTGQLSQSDFSVLDINQDGLLNAEDIKAVTKAEAIKVYKKYWWDKYGYIAISDQNIATKIFDLAVNMGPCGAHICAQRAVRAAIGLALIEDGKLGYASFTAINMCKPDLLMCALKSEAAGYYRSIKSESASKYIKGWLRRAYDSVIMDDKK